MSYLRLLEVVVDLIDSLSAFLGNLALRRGIINFLWHIIIVHFALSTSNWRTHFLRCNLHNETTFILTKNAQIKAKQKYWLPKILWFFMQMWNMFQKIHHFDMETIQSIGLNKMDDCYVDVQFKFSAHIQEK